MSALANPPSPLRVLVVDDDDIMRRLVRRILRGWEVYEAAAPEDVTPDWDTYDVVVIDWRPKGPETLRRCREAGVPHLIFTGTPEDEDIPKGVRVVAKPLRDPEELRSAIEEVAHG